MSESKSWKVWSGLSVFVWAMISITNGASFAAAERAEAKLELSGKTIVISYGQPSTDGKGYKSMKDGVPEGFLWRMGLNEATTIETDGDLKFGDQTIEAGKYSLAGKKTEDGWNLLVHPKAERWGSPVPEDGYVATIPLKVGEPKKESELMTISLNEKDGKGMFKLVWGDTKLTAGFEVAE